jgi:hypothetical protein
VLSIAGQDATPTQRGFLCFLIGTALALPLVAYRFLAQHRGGQRGERRNACPQRTQRTLYLVDIA